MFWVGVRSILVGMTRIELERQIMALPEAERLEIADAVWARLDDPDTLPLPSWQRDLLDERLASIDDEEGRDWEDVKAEIWPPGR
jgi:putative addiction module component (TIGR02574 family)